MWYWSWVCSTLTTWCEELTHWNRPWCWERVRAGEGDGRGWDGWMASPARWTWVWASPWSWWWTGKPGVLQSMGSQWVGHDWVTELNWSKSDRERQIPYDITYMWSHFLWFWFFFNLLRLVLWPNIWSILHNVPLSFLEKKVYSPALEGMFCECLLGCGLQ